MVILQEFIDFAVKRKIKLRQIFDHLDKNKNGLIELNEVKDSMKELGIEVKDDSELKHLFSKVDKNKSGSIDFDEWLVCTFSSKFH